MSDLDAAARVRATYPLSFRVSAELYEALRADAQQLGVTIADVSRFRLRSASTPRFDTNVQIRMEGPNVR
jgi:hypothetical protein